MSTGEDNQDMALIKATGVDEAFMARPRIATFISSRDSRAPFGVPVWFDWDGAQIQFFSARDAYKIRCLQKGHPRALLVHNRPDEPEQWFSFEGRPAVAHEAPRTASRNGADIPGLVDRTDDVVVPFGNVNIFVVPRVSLIAQEEISARAAFSFTTSTHSSWLSDPSG